MPGDSVAIMPIDGKGNGLVAQTAFEPGETILRHPALVALQLFSNDADVQACGNCLRCVGSLATQLLWMADADDCDAGRVNWDAVPHSATPVAPIAACPHGDCDMVFCSDECGQQAWSGFHRIFCCADSDAFDAHASQHDQLFFTLRRLIATLLAKLTDTNNPVSLNACMQPLLAFHFVPWHLIPDEDRSAQERFEVLGKSAQILQEIAESQLGKSFPQEAAELFAPSTYARLAGILALNCVSVQFQSPQRQYFELLATRPPSHTDEVRSNLQPLFEQITHEQATRWADDEDEDQVVQQQPDFPFFEGTALVLWQ